MAPLPGGTVAFLFTDIEGSTALWERDRQAMAAAVDRHFALLGEAVAAQDGVLFKTIGDAAQAAFPAVPNAIAAAIAAQLALRREDWGDFGPTATCGWRFTLVRPRRKMATISPPHSIASPACLPPATASRSC